MLRGDQPERVIAGGAKICWHTIPQELDERIHASWLRRREPGRAAAYFGVWKEVIEPDGSLLNLAVGPARPTAGRVVFRGRPSSAPAVRRPDAMRAAGSA